jgi:hypothetical protein
MSIQNSTEVTPRSNLSNPVFPEKKSQKNLIIGLLLFALIGSWIYFIWENNNYKDSLNDKNNIINTTSVQRDNLQKSLDSTSNEYDIIKAENEQKDSILIIKDKEIEAKKTRVKQLLSKVSITNKDLTEAKSLISSLNQEIEGYKAQIARLKAENASLTQQNETITEEKNKLKSDLDNSVSEIKNKDNIINIGSTLHASNFNVLGLDLRNNGKIKETTNAKKVDKLRINFDLDENLITPSGNKELYIIVYDPTGKICAENELGSGKFRTREGELKSFTNKMDVNYEQNKRQTISFDWNTADKFVIGTYKIEVYNNGFKIGEGKCPLKKGGIFG